MCNKFNRWQAFVDQIMAIEIIGKQFLQTVQDLMIGDFSGNELPLIKTFGIAEQRFDLSNDDILAELVNIGMVFILDNFLK